MKNKIFIGICILNAILISAVVYFGITEEIVPIHYGSNGVPDSYGSKWTYLLFALIPFILSVGLDKSLKQNVNNPNNIINEKYKDKIIPGIIFLFIALGWYFTINVMNNRDNLPSNFVGFLTIIIGFLLIWISNIMAKLKPNKDFGLRVSWTLNSETVWKKTHRFAGYSGVFGGLIMVAGGLFTLLRGAYMPAAICMIIGIMFVALIPTIYAWNAARIENSQKKTK